MPAVADFAVNDRVRVRADIPPGHVRTPYYLRGKLVEKNVVTPAEISAQIAAMDARSPADGAALVARAWTDPAFFERLMQDGSAAASEMGFDVGPMKLIAVANTPTLHNVVVCTLCSCYPRNLLGLPPDWYKSRVTS